MKMIGMCYSIVRTTYKHDMQPGYIMLLLLGYSRFGQHKKWLWTSVEAKTRIRQGCLKYLPELP
jgi:hypothetical protein